MPLKKRWREGKDWEDEEHNSLMIWELEEYIGSWRRQENEKSGKVSESQEYKEEIQAIFHKSTRQQ